MRKVRLIGCSEVADPVESGDEEWGSGKVALAVTVHGRRAEGRRRSAAITRLGFISIFPV
jgi:hypothetical protein